MTKRKMEEQANRNISSNMMVEESEQHLEVLRSYGFQFGKKTGSRFIAAVHEIVGIVAKQQIAEMHGTILALKLDVNDLNGRLIEQTEKTKSAENLYDEIQKKLEVVEADLFLMVQKNKEMEERSVNIAEKNEVLDDDTSEPITMSMCANQADYEAKTADATPMTEAETVEETMKRG